jgi:hypothetical protein
MNAAFHQVIAASDENFGARQKWTTSALEK